MEPRLLELIGETGTFRRGNFRIIERRRYFPRVYLRVCVLKKNANIDTNDQIKYDSMEELCMPNILYSERISYSILFSSYSNFLFKQTVSAYLCKRPFKMTCLHRNTNLETVYRSSLYSVRFFSCCLHIVIYVKLVASN